MIVGCIYDTLRTTQVHGNKGGVNEEMGRCGVMKGIDGLMMV